MRYALKIFFLILAVSVLNSKAQEAAPLRLVTTTSMPGFMGDFDHFGLDLKGNRLFLAAEEHQTVEVFDLRTGARVHSIEGFGHPLTMAYLPKANQLVVTDAEQSAVRLVDCKHYTIVKTIRLKPEVDHSAISNDSKHFYVENAANANGSTHSLAIIDTDSFIHVGDIEGLPGSSNEGMVIDRAGTRLYVNLTGADAVGVVDLKSRRLVDKWPLPDAHVAHAIALDETNHRLFTVTRSPALFIVYDTETGKVVASLPCVGVNSDISIDSARRRIYITGSEAASVFRQIDANHYEHLSDVPTAYRAKTSMFVPQLNRLYVAVSGKGKPDAKLELRIYEPQ